MPKKLRSSKHQKTRERERERERELINQVYISNKLHNNYCRGGLPVWAIAHQCWPPKKTQGRPCTTWLNNINNNLKLSEARDAAQNRSFWRMLAPVVEHADIYYADQRHNHVFKVGGPIPWSMAKTLLQKKQVYPVWCSRLHNHTPFTKKLRKKLGGPSKFWGGLDPPVVAPMMLTRLWPIVVHCL